jgi:prepilin-type N-terminal cleavage/methylation domain-containing protein
MSVSAKKGFTLTELLIVVVIIAILAAIALPKYQRAVEKTRWAQAVIFVNSLSDAWERHYLATGSYTSNMNDLDITVPQSKWFSAPVFHTSPLPHIQTQRNGSGSGGLWVTRYSTTKMTYCTAQNGAAGNNKFCAEYTGQLADPGPESGYTCYKIR